MNFVSSRPERIAQAKRIGARAGSTTVPNDAEFIPLPEDPPPVRYLSAARGEGGTRAHDLDRDVAGAPLGGLGARPRDGRHGARW